MHWLEKWRRENSFSKGDLAHAVRVSWALIDMLENHAGCITHSKIADRIADYTGATVEQRDSIVHKQHRGTWKPDPRRSAGKQKKREEAAKTSHNCRIVVALNTAGVSMDVYPSERAAAQAVGCTSQTVHNRCARDVKATTNEFSPYGLTFRFADEWFAMTPQQQFEDMLSAQAFKKEKIT